MSSGVKSWRFVVPNLITGLGAAFGFLSLLSAASGDYVASGWWIIYAVLTDKLDGFAARLLGSSSELGSQLDSLCDFLCFGVAPAFLVYVYLQNTSAYFYGAGDYLLTGASIFWVLATAFRLARFNSVSDDSTVFRGMPSTMAGGLLAVWLLTLLKYSEHSGFTAGFTEPYLFGYVRVSPLVWRYFPIVMLGLSLAMVSRIAFAKVGRTKSKSMTAFIVANLLAGYVCGFARIFPEYCLLPPTIWMVVFLVRGIRLWPAGASVASTQLSILPAEDELRGGRTEAPVVGDVIDEVIDEVLEDASHPNTDAKKA